MLENSFSRGTRASRDRSSGPHFRKLLARYREAVLSAEPDCSKTRARFPFQSATGNPSYGITINGRKYNLAITNRLTSKEINVPLLHRLHVSPLSFIGNDQIANNDKGQQIEQRYVYFVWCHNLLLWYVLKRRRDRDTNVVYLITWRTKIYRGKVCMPVLTSLSRGARVVSCLHMAITCYTSDIITPISNG